MSGGRYFVVIAPGGHLPGLLRLRGLRSGGPFRTAREARRWAKAHAVPGESWYVARRVGRPRVRR